MKKNSLNLWLIIVMAVACLLVVGINADRDSVSREIAELEAALDNSYAAWRATADLNEELLEEIELADEALREAELSMKESQEKSASIREQMVELEAQKAALEAELKALQEQNQ